MAKRYMAFRRYLANGLWRNSTYELSWVQRLGVHFLRLQIMLCTTLKSNRCHLWASALTYYSIFTLVPVIALGIGIAKGFGLDAHLKDYLNKQFANNPQMLDYILNFAEKALEHTKFGIVAGIGVFMLLFAVIKMLSNIESAFNFIWGIHNQRPLLLKASYYLSVLLICPVFLIAAGSATAMMNNALAALGAHYVLYPFTIIGMKFIPFVMVWIIFTLIYKMLPNTTVQIKAAIVGAVVAGTLYQFLQIGFFALQIALSQYNAIYGSFSALPLFLIYLQLSWIILLFGTQISFICQNFHNIDVAPHGTKLTPYFRRKLYLAVSSAVVQRYMDLRPPLTDAEIAGMFKLPPRVANKILDNLCTAKILIPAPSLTAPNEVHYLPLLPPEQMTVYNVLRRCDNIGRGLPPILSDELSNKIDKLLSDYYSETVNSHYNIKLQDIR